MDYVSIHTGSKIDENITKVDTLETKVTTIENTLNAKKKFCNETISYWIN